MSERQPILTGGCQCGAIRYALYATPEDVHLCHCRMCQKAVGGPFAALAPVRSRDFEWVRGEPAFYQSSSIALRDYCADCGTPLSFRFLDDDYIDVTLGSLDDPDKAPPTTHYGVESRHRWLVDIAQLPEETTEASMKPERLEALSNYQHPDYPTGVDWRSPGSKD